jgi:hypothetical protein
MSISKARAEVVDIREQMEAGIDPVVRKQQEQVEMKSGSFAEFAKQYMELAKTKKRPI